METRERIISAYNHLKDVGIISSQQNVADRMGIRKEWGLEKKVYLKRLVVIKVT